MIKIARPQPDEYIPYYGQYIALVPEPVELIPYLDAQPGALKDLLSKVTDRQAGVRPAPGEWSIKEVIGHLCDSERIFAFRALWFARANPNALPGFESDDFVAATDFNSRTLHDLLDEFTLQRGANIRCFAALTEAELERRGIASGNPFSVRALLYNMAGHVVHHMDSLETVYQVKV